MKKSLQKLYHRELEWFFFNIIIIFIITFFYIFFQFFVNKSVLISSQKITNILNILYICMYIC